MIAYTGGKTGGHIMPLIRLIKSSNTEALYVGYLNDLEDKICCENNISFFGMRKYKSKFWFVHNFFELKKYLKDKNIELVISTGGKNSTILCLYAVIYKIPLYLIEENCIRGFSNLLFYPFCKKMFLAFPLKKIRKKEIVTGLPVKEDDSFFNKEYDVLIIGGSLGSKPLCDIACKLHNSYKVCLISGRYYDDYKNYEFESYSFSNDLYSLIIKSRVVISRGGASTSSEIFYLNTPFICIPSKKTKRNHQVINALYFNNLGIAKYVDEDDFNGILKNVDLLLNDNNQRLEMIIRQKIICKKNPISMILKEINNG